MSKPTTTDHECAACDGLGPWLSSSDPCPVCLGSGRISDRMPARDAVADAETLLNLKRSLFRGFMFNHTDLAHVQALGQRATGGLTGSAGLTPPHAYARSAARAAFRAVPGLRG